MNSIVKIYSFQVDDSILYRKILLIFGYSNLKLEIKKNIVLK
jgi:hypothetical protein